MTIISIPERHKGVLARLRELEDAVFQKLISEIASLPPLTRIEDATSFLASRDIGLSLEDIEKIIDLSLSLHMTCIHRNFSISEFAEDISKIMEKSDDEKLKLVEKTREKFKGRLRNLLEIESLNYIAKAISLFGDYERRFCTARILTDIRPIFSPEPEMLPKATVITHTLNITYHKSNDVDNFYISLTNKDLKKLLEVLERANTKHKNLKPIIDSAGIRLYDSYKEEGE